MSEPPLPAQPARVILHATIKVPITCPVCGAEALIELNAVQTRDALLADRPIYLHSFCHSAIWNASEKEIEQIRDHLATVQIPKTRKPSECDDHGGGQTGG